jgi:predicted N-formylglutamate amidohydrolase
MSLEPDRAYAYEILNPQGRAPVLLVCDHASRAFPEHLGTLGVAEPDTFEHIAWDIGAAEVTRGLSRRLDATAVLCRWSRLVVDCNRRLSDPTAFIEISDGIPVPGNASISVEDREWRVKEIWESYHAAIDGILDQRVTDKTCPIFLSIHSFTPLLGDIARPWHVGVLWDQDDRVAVPVLESLRSVDGLHVGDNEPYSGRHPTDYTLHAHAGSRGLPYLGFEIRQDLLATQGGIEYWVGLLEAAIDHALAQPGIRRTRRQPMQAVER